MCTSFDIRGSSIIPVNCAPIKLEWAIEANPSYWREARIANPRAWSAISTGVAARWNEIVQGKGVPIISPMPSVSEDEEMQSEKNGGGVTTPDGGAPCPDVPRLPTEQQENWDGKSAKGSPQVARATLSGVMGISGKCEIKCRGSTIMDAMAVAGYMMRRKGCCKWPVLKYNAHPFIGGFLEKKYV